MPENLTQVYYTQPTAFCFMSILYLVKTGKTFKMYSTLSNNGSPLKMPIVALDSYHVTLTVTLKKTVHMLKKLQESGSVRK